MLLLHANNAKLLVYMQQAIENHLSKNNGLITSSWCRENNIPTIYLSRMAKKGILQQVEKGLYLAPDSANYDEMYFFQYRYKKAVFSYESALSLWKMSDKIISVFDVTVPQGYKFNQQPQNAVVHYANKDIFSIGIAETKTPFGNIVRTYSLERTVCDFIRHKEKCDTEVFVKFLQNYAKSQEKDMNALYRYAKAMNIIEEVRSVMEILL